MLKSGVRFFLFFFLDASFIYLQWWEVQMLTVFFSMLFDQDYQSFVYACPATNQLGTFITAKISNGEKKWETIYFVPFSKYNFI